MHIFITLLLLFLFLTFAVLCMKLLLLPPLLPPLLLLLLLLLLLSLGVAVRAFPLRLCFFFLHALLSGWKPLLSHFCLSSPTAGKYVGSSKVARRCHKQCGGAKGLKRR
uniref:Uncharacterized protein n=1 Tax=Trypanosoma congolense (strain IL3000) TaxID=1068625 RepID=G0URC8_TRYCI|nr:hypothetical protein, unlikely [Trypanosoma congolense IL3000]